MSDNSGILAQIYALLPDNTQQEITPERVRQSFALAVDGVSSSVNSEFNSTASVISCAAVFPFDDTIPQVTEGTEVVTASITPLSPTSNIQITYSVTGSTTHGASLLAAIFQDVTTDALTGSVSMAQTTGANQKFNMSWTFQVPSGSILSRTYKLRLGPDGGAIAYVNGDNIAARLFGGSCTASITLTEVGS